MSDPTVLARDAGHYGRYIVNRRPSERAIALYCAAATALFAEVEERDAVLVFVRGNPWAIPLLDAALALVDPRAVLRRRLAIMFAILETQPELAPAFASYDHTPLDIVKLFAAAATTGAALAGGFVLLALIRKCQ